jgi:8-oxo-dGTP diphosphatase
LGLKIVKGPPSKVPGVGRFSDVGRSVANVLRPRKARHDLVRAAGGILLRPAGASRFEVALVHRPDRDDWSLPKGKLDPGESYEDCALREVLEETGYRCRLLDFVGFTEYRDRRNRQKVVGYWIMEVVGGEFAPSSEVDRLQWLDLEVAAHALTYERDRELLVALDIVDLARSGCRSPLLAAP